MMRNGNTATAARSTKLRGTIKTIKFAEGFGFITHSATGEDYFFHRSELRDSKVPFEDLHIDQPVEFVPNDNGPKGLRAQQITVL